MILVAAALALLAGPPLPNSLSGLTVVGPYIVLLLGVAISAWFNRGRALIMLVSLLAAYAGYSIAAGARRSELRRAGGIDRARRVSSRSTSCSPPTFPTAAYASTGTTAGSSWGWPRS